MFYKFDDIVRVHLELNDNCNANCLLCGRKNNKQLPGVQLLFDDIKKIFPINFIKRLNLIYLCGNFGEPTLAKDILQILSYFREVNKEMFLGIYTNGSTRDKNWWKILSNTLGDKGYVKFSIDGLKDTNHIYRQNTNFDKIITNVKAFIEEGGKAYWDYIVFAHNEHQVEEAKNLSKEMGFKGFQIKKTHRFSLFKEHPILHPPISSKYRNYGWDQLKKLIDEDKEKFKDYWNNSKINCKAFKQKNMFVSSEGILQPCCWLAGQMYTGDVDIKINNQIWKLINEVGKDKLNAKINAIQDIINGEYFQKIIPNNRENINILPVCSKICGGKYDLFANQYCENLNET